MFCPKCGAKIDDTARFCNACGSGVETGATVELKVVRPNQFFVYNPAIRVTVDNDKVYKVENDACVVIPLTLGSHVLSFAASMRKKVVEVQITGNKTLEVKWNRVTGSIEVKE